MAFNLYNTDDDAEAYSKYILEHPDALYDAIKAFCNSNNESSECDFAVDLGCGAGNSTMPLSKLFKKVVGVDISAALIDIANSNIPSDGSVTFKVGAAEDLHFVEDSSVDLISLGLAIHWMDTEKLTKTIERVLKPGGTVSAYGLKKMALDNRIADDHLNKVYVETVIPATGIPKDRSLLRSDYVFPFEETARREEITIKKRWSVETFMQFFISVFSLNRTMMKMFPNTTIYDDLNKTLSDIYGGSKEDVVDVTFTYFLFLARKPIKPETTKHQV